MRNPVYIGKVRHKDELHDGLHDAILDDHVWQAVQELLANHGGKTITTKRRPATRALDGRLFDAIGRPMGSTYANKSVKKDGAQLSKRYWYYVSKKRDDADDVKARRLPANAIEEVVRAAVVEQFTNRVWLAGALREQHVNASDTAMVLTKLDAFTTSTSVTSSNPNLHKWIAPLLKRVDLASETMCITMDLVKLTAEPTSDRNMHLRFEVPFTLYQNGRAKPIVIATVGQTRQRNPDLIALVADAKRWMAELIDGHVASVQQITEREGLRSGTVSRVLPLAYVAPDISAALLDGHQPATLSAKRLRELRDLPLAWSEQRRVLGFPSI